MSCNIKQLENLFKEGASIVDLLPYYECFEGTFINTDGSLSRMWEVELVEAELKTKEELLATSDNLELILQKVYLPNTCCQLILCNDSFFDEKLLRYQELNQATGPAIIDECTQQKIAHIKDSKDGFFKNEHFFPRRLRAFFTVRIFPEWAHPSMVDKIKFLVTGQRTIEQHLEHDFEKHQAVLNTLSEKVVNAFAACNIETKSVDEKSLTTLLYKIFNPKRSEQIPEPVINPNNSIRENIVYNVPEVTHKGLSLEGHTTRVVTIKENPAQTIPGMFSLQSAGENGTCLLDLVKNFMIVINITVPDQQEALQKLKIAKFFSYTRSLKQSGDINVEEAEKKRELDETIKTMFSEGKKLVLARTHFVVIEEDEKKAEKACEQIMVNLNRIGCEGIKEDIIGFSLFLTCLPMNFDDYFDKSIKREKQMFSSNVADMYPYYSSFKGTKNAAQMYLNRRGEISYFDLFSSDTNPHGIVTGCSGAGKSFFMNDFILQDFRLGSHFFILDKGDSYKKLCNVLSGQYVRFDLNNPLTINPFYRKPSPENIAFLVAMISQMASGVNKQDRLSREDEGLIQKAVQVAYSSFKDREVILSDVVELLKNNDFNQTHGLNDLTGKRIALKLAPFIKGGAYGQFFDGPNQFEVKNRFTVFELANLSSHQDLQLVVLLNIMFFITNFISSKEMLPKRKYLLIDEAWSLLKLKNTANFITNAFKTFRKYRCSTVAITQELADLTNEEAGIAIQANAANKIILKQEPSVVDLLREGMSLNDKEIKTLKSLRTVKGKFSEALILSESTKGVVRLVTYPLLYWIANTEPVNNNYLYKTAAQEGSLLKALTRCAKEHPDGIK